uniref:Nitroreductase domain-containing protein n=1 Tax=Dechloromonas aromatica (strain RCB) TaxID=159087 RepID=Q47G60_DECAR
MNTQPESPRIVPDTPQDIVRAYHARTKHRFDAYAEGPGQLDWDAQPAAFRHYPGAPQLELPLTADRYERCFAQLPAQPDCPITPDLNSLGALLELSFGLSAWKSWGPNRWALRCNPSSGNLHPVEAYVLSAGLPGVGDGLHHYDPEDHALEGRALRGPVAGEAWLAVGLSSIMWREAWKYGERAFRYCQLDVGHAIGALAYAAALLGWEVVPLAIDGKTLGHNLGLDRADDFPSSRYAFTETEEPELLLAIRAPGLSMPPTAELLVEWLNAADWQGKPSRIDPSPGYRWPAIDQVAAASREGMVRAQGSMGFAPLPPLGPHPNPVGAAQIIRQRRSGQRFDPRYSLSKPAFYRMLDAVLPRPQSPWLAQQTSPRIHLLLFVLRVEGLASGLYLLPRSPAAATALPAALVPAEQRFAGRRPVADFDPECPAHLGLIQLAEMGLQEMQRLARSLSCHQDIASTSAFSLGMLGEFEAATADAHGYRELLREAGLVGQVLYLEAEAAGVRGTGIGCFFDDPVHQVAGLSGQRYQSVYHFTVGTPITDERIETGPPYPQRQKE